MKTASKIFWSTLLVALSLAMPARAVPQLLGYQGRLLNADGTADSKVQKIRFSVWDLETGGLNKWEEVQTIGLTNGFYATYLGQVTAFPTSLFDGSDLYLQVSLIDAANNEEILTPRQRVGSVAYALKAGSAQSVAGGGTVDATAVTVNGQPALTSVSATAPIAGNGTATSPLALGPCASGEILKWSGTAWACAADLAGTGTVSVVGVTAPLASSGGTSPVISISKAGSAADGYLAAADWANFNGKLDTVGHDTSITGAGTAASPLGLKACAGGQILKWNGVASAWECALDADSGGTVTAVTAAGPLASTGGATPNISIAPAGTAASGYLTSADWNAFSNKVSSVVGTAPIVSSGGVAPAISIVPATPLTPGSMSAADKAKLDAITSGAAVASVGASAPLASSGGTTPVISIQKATNSVDGYLAAADWTTFNNKLAAVSHDASLVGAGTAASALGIKSCAIDGQILKWNATTSTWNCMADSNAGGTVTSIGTGTGLVGGPIATTGIVSIDTAVVPRLGVANTFTVGGQTIQTGVASNKGLLVQGVAGQTANLQEWQNSAGTAVASVSALGDISGFSFTGSGSGLTSLNASSLASGTVPLARLGGITTAQLSATAGITNAQLASSSVTVTAGTGLTGGGAAPLGGTVTLGIGTVPIANGGTGATTAPAALANLGGASLGAANIFTTGAQTIQTGTAANKGLLVQGSAAQTANLQEWQNNLGTAQASVSSAGVISGAGFAGSGAGLTGLNASSLASGTVPSAVVAGAYPGVTGVGTIASGTWQGTAVGAAYGGTGINSSTAVAGSILRTTGVGTWGTLPPGTNGQVLTLAAGLPAWANPATSGTVTNVATGLGLSGGPITATGTLTIDPLVVPQLGAANTFTAGAQTIQTGAATNKGLLVKGAALQSVNLQEWQDSLGTALASVNSIGVFSGSGANLTALNASSLATGTVPLARLSGITSAQLSATAGITGSQLSATAGITNAQLASSSITVTPGAPLTGGGAVSLGGTVTLGLGTVPVANGGTGATTAPAALTNLGGASLSAANIFTIGAQTIQTGAAANKGLLVQGAAAQTANLQEWQNSAGTALASVSGTGAITAAGFTGSGAGLTALNGSSVASGLVGAAFGGTGSNTSAAAAGSILRTTGVGTWATLPPGINGQILTVSAGSPTWANPATSGTVTSVGTGLGLSGGPITTTGSLAIDPLVVPQLGAANNFTTGAQTIQTGLATNKGLLVKGAAAQAANLQEWQNSAGTAVAAVSSLGDIMGLTFTGSGSGLTSLNATNLATGTVPLARLAGLTSAQLAAAAGITNAQLANSSVTVTPSAPLTGGGAVALGGAVTLGLGTVPIANGGTGATTASAALTNLGGASLNAANIFTTGAQTIQTGAAANKGLLVQGAAVQTANLQEWQNNLGTALASVSSAGVFTGSGAGLTALNATNLASGTVPLARLIGITSAQLSPTAGITGSQLAAAAGITNAQLANSSITVTPGVGLTGGGVVPLGGAVTLGIGTVPVANGGTGATTAPAALTNLGGASLTAANTFTTGAQTIQTGLAANKGLLVQGAAAQTANLQEWQNNLGTALASVSNAGGFSGASMAVTGAATIGGTLTSTGNGTIGGVGIGTVATGYYGDPNNLAARFPGAAGDFYVQSASAAATYARFGAGIGGGAIYGNLSVSGNITAANLNSTAATNVGGNLSVTGSSTFTGDVSGVPRGRNLINWTSTMSKWTVIGASTPTITLNTADVLEGDSSFDFTIPALGSGSTLTYGDFIPVDPNRHYEGRISAKLVSGAGTFYAGYVAYDANKVVINGNPGLYGYFIASGVAPGATWSTYTGFLQGEGAAIDNFPVGTRFIKPLIIVNYLNVGSTRVDGFEIWETGDDKVIVLNGSRYYPTYINQGEDTYGAGVVGYLIDTCDGLSGQFVCPLNARLVACNDVYLVGINWYHRTVDCRRAITFLEP